MASIVLISAQRALEAELVRVLGSGAELAVAATAKRGDRAVALVLEHRPDVVVLDSALSGPSVTEITNEIMHNRPTPVLIVHTPGSDREVAFEALRCGAIDVLSASRNDNTPMALSTHAVVRALKTAVGVRLVTRRKPRRQPGTRSRPTPTLHSLVAIGCSTGGPAALLQLLSALPTDFPAPILVVQHMTEGFNSQFVHWLNAAVPLEVALPQSGTMPQPGVVYVAAEDRHLTVDADGHLALSRAGPVGGHRPSATVLFESLALSGAGQRIGVILTGMGSDGADGLRTLHDSGGYTLAQNEASSVVFGMPKAAIDAGAADEILPLDGVAGRLLALVRKR